MKRLVVSLLTRAGLVSVSVVSTQAAPDAPKPKDTPTQPAQGKLIPNQYIAVLNDGPRITASSVAAEVQASPAYVYAAALNGFAATLNAEQLHALQKYPDVAFIEQDQEVTIANAT